MTERTFSQALRRGLGSAIVELKNAGNATAYRDVLLRCCLRDISYDWQSEGTKGYYLYDALLASGEPEYYERAIIEKFLSRCYDGLFYQLSAILYRFADDGSEDAKEALHSKYDYFASKKGRLRETPPVHEGSQWDEVVFHLLSLDGFSAFKRYAEDVGKILLHDSENRAMYDGWFEVRVKNIFGKKKVDAFFDRNYGRSAAVKALVDTLKIRSDGVNLFQAEAKRRKITIDDLLQIARGLAAEERPRLKMTGSIYRFAKKASDSEMRDLAYAALHEEHETVRALLLKPFGLKTTWSRPFPLDISPLMEYAWSENTLLAESAIDCLEAFKDKRIHDLAVQLLERKGLGSFALALLIRNYRKTDDALIAGLIGKSGVIPHHVQQDIGEIYCRHRSADALPILLHTYRRGECAFCRHYIVRAMHRCGGVPMKILKECLYDCYDETRDFAKRLIKRSSIHSEGDGMNVRQLS